MFNSSKCLANFFPTAFPEPLPSRLTYLKIKFSLDSMKFLKSSSNNSWGLSCSDLPTSVYENPNEKDINKDNEKLDIKISQKRLEI